MSTHIKHMRPLHENSFYSSKKKIIEKPDPTRMSVMKALQEHLASLLE